MGPHKLLLTGSSGRPRCDGADRANPRRTRGGSSARVSPPTTQTAAGEHRLTRGSWDDRTRLAAIRRGDRPRRVGGHTTPARRIRRGHAGDSTRRAQREEARHAAEQRRATESNARAPEDASVTHGKMVVETRSKEHHQAEPPARTAQCRALHRPSTQSPTATVQFTPRHWARTEGGPRHSRIGARHRRPSSIATGSFRGVGHPSYTRTVLACRERSQR